GGDEVLVLHRGHEDAVARLGLAFDRHVDDPCEERFAEVIPRHEFAETNAYARKTFAKVAHRGGKDREDRRGSEPDAERPSLPFADASKERRRVRGIREDAPSFGEEESAALGQTHSSLAAIEQGAVEDPFELLDLLAER